MLIMNLSRFKSTTLFILFIIFSPPLWATFTSQFDANVGQSSFRVAAQNNERNVDSLSAVELVYALTSASTGVAYTLNMFEMIGSSEVPLAFTRLSLGCRWYPLGVNGSTVILDNDVKAKIWKPTPYLGGNLGITNLSTKDYNASLFDTTIRLGVEVPVTAMFLINIQYLMSQSLSGSSKGPERDINYAGNSIMIGFVFSSLGGQ